LTSGQDTHPRELTQGGVIGHLVALLSSGNQVRELECRIHSYSLLS
jgi:hypothetical protein